MLVQAAGTARYLRAAMAGVPLLALVRPATKGYAAGGVKLRQDEIQ